MKSKNSLKNHGTFLEFESLYMKGKNFQKGDDAIWEYSAKN